MAHECPVRDSPADRPLALFAEGGLEVEGVEEEAEMRGLGLVSLVCARRDLQGGGGLVSVMLFGQERYPAADLAQHDLSESAYPLVDAGHGRQRAWIGEAGRIGDLAERSGDLPAAVQPFRQVSPCETHIERLCYRRIHGPDTANVVGCGLGVSHGRDLMMGSHVQRPPLQLCPCEDQRPVRLPGSQEPACVGRLVQPPSDSHAVLTRMADVLRVEVEELTGPGGGDGEEGQRVYEPAAEIERAMMGYEAVSASIGGRQPGASAAPVHLRARASAAYAGYQATRYDDTGRMLPALIRETEAGAGGNDREACSVRALVYDTAAALLHRVGETSLAWTAADRALAAAEQSGRPELVALQAYRLSYVIADRKHPAEALELAMSASAGLERVMRGPDADTLSVYGALHLAGVHAAAAVYDRAMTATLLARARDIAARTGDGKRMGTAFGHANVAMHAISASLQLGDAKAAIETGESLDPASLPAGLTGRRTQLSLDLARAYAMRKQDAAAMNLLLAAERLSPQLVRYDGRTREVITSLLRREHQPSTPELRPLARRAGVI
jgi:hypothetical protein